MPRDEQPDDVPATPDRLHPVAGASSELQDEEVQAGQTVKDEPVLEGPAAKKRILALEVSSARSSITDHAGRSQRAP